MSLEKVSAVAEGEVGVHEEPRGSNRVKYWQDYDPSGAWQGQPWCVSGVWWCFQKAGESAAFLGGGQTASCGIMLRWFREMDQTVSKQEIQRGDIPILNFSGTLDTEHCGIVTEVVRSNGSILYIRTIEFNTSDGGSQTDGDSVCRKIRYPRQVVAVCRPKYKAEETIPVDDIKGHWSQRDALWCKENKIMTGYPDGSFRPENPVLRGEGAAIAHRLYDYTFSRLMEEITELKKEVARIKEAMK